MKKELLDKWLVALRSGDYKQTQTVLMEKSPNKHKSSFCCLGVLCKVAGINIAANIAQANGEEGQLSEKTKKRVGLTAEQENVFANMNDNQGLTFSEIADKIESNPEEFVGLEKENALV